MTPLSNPTGPPLSQTTAEPSIEPPTTKAPRKEWEAPDVLARPIPFVACSEREFSIWVQGYETGYAHGFDRGAEYRDEEWQALHDRARRIVRAASTWPERKR